MQLSDVAVAAWAKQATGYGIPTPSPGAGELEGGTRVLFVQPNNAYSGPPPLTLTDIIYDTFGLPAYTVAFLTRNAGLTSLQCEPDGSSPENCDRLAIILRSPKKYEITNGGLALSYDFNTSISTVVIYGQGYNIDDVIRGEQSPKLDLFTEALGSCHSKWSHLLLLPSLFARDHARRVHRHLSDRIGPAGREIEGRIDVIAPGRGRQSVDLARRLFKEDHLQRSQATDLTKKINNLYTQMLFVKRSPQWDLDTIDFLVEILDTSKRLQNYQNVSAQSFREQLKIARNFSEASAVTTQETLARLQLQLDILYTSVAQDDNQTSARLAASAGKDSTSMKILAVITAAFLPGTFVATLFSMSMFDWQAGSEGNSTPSIVSSRFYVYWAVAAPLTIATLLGWALWWRIEMQRFENEVEQSTQHNAFRREKNTIHGVP